MKSILLIWAAILIASGAQAQVSFGPEIGVNACAYFAPGASGNSNSIIPGVRAGIKADKRLYQQFHLLTGLLYVSNGYTPGGNLMGGNRPTLNIHTIEIPFQFLYRS